MLPKKLFKQLPKSCIAYVRDIEKLAKKHNVKVVFHDTEFLPRGDAGLFGDKPTAMLEVATNCPFDMWFPVLIHEANHMKQWIAKIPEWKNATLDSFFGIDALDLIENWHNKELELTKEQFTSYIKKIIDVELDCEKRTVLDMIKYNLPFDRLKYIQQSNAYIYFYSIMWYTRKWNKPGYAPHNVEGVWKFMPTHFDNDYLNVPEHIKAIIIRETIEGYTNSQENTSE